VWRAVLAHALRLCLRDLTRSSQVPPLTARQGSHFDAQRSKPVSRSMFAEEYVNPDSTHTVRQSTMPLNVADGKGGWRPVDTVTVIGLDQKHDPSRSAFTNP
jgi:hypothetical protein